MCDNDNMMRVAAGGDIYMYISIYLFIIIYIDIYIQCIYRLWWVGGAVSCATTRI